MYATLTHTDIETAVRAATLAPSVLNVQPWRFVAHGDVIELHRDPDRALPVTDPSNRALTISCGAALFNLRLAIAHLVGHPAVDVLPDPARPTLLAVVRPGDGTEPSAMESRLYVAIRDRRSSRVPSRPRAATSRWVMLASWFVRPVTTARGKGGGGGGVGVATGDDEAG